MGPLSFDDLKKENITGETLIWFEGLDDWTAAREIVELNEIFELMPPPILEHECEIVNNEFHEITSKLSDDEFEIQIKEEGTKFKENQAITCKQRMFKNSFSFDGRIRRLEYWLSIVIWYVYLFSVILLVYALNLPEYLVLFYLPGFFFLWAQGSKRCHDLGNSGWYQIIPFYGLWMLFVDGEQTVSNKYGINPKN